MRAVVAALPDNLGGLDADDVRALVESLTDTALNAGEGELAGGATSLYGATSLTYDMDAPVPDELRLGDGRSAYQPPAGRLYATVGQLAAERALREATVKRGRAAVSAEAAAEAIARYTEATGVELGADQAAAVRGVLTSGAAVEVLVGPAGTGKSCTIGALAAAWTDQATWGEGSQPPRVVGLAASQIAADVLAGEGLTAANVARWLAAQQRLEAGRGSREDEAWRLRAGDLVVVDEASMADTTAIARIYRYVDAAGGKLLLTGDHRQLTAVGAGGAFDLVVREAVTYELAEVRRFAATWERDASLRLRDGDLSAVRDYDRHGRLIDAGTVEQAAAAARRAWLADTLAGRRSLLLVDTNEQAAQVAAEARADLVRLNRVGDDVTVPLERDGNRAGVGDLVQARLLAPHLRGYEGNTAGPVNREYYRVTATRPDGGLIVAPIVGTGPDGERLGAAMVLPGSYVREHVVLGYASTVHSAQGLTVDTSHTVLTPWSSAASAYVALTRGRECNTAYVATLTAPPDAPAGEVHQAERRSPAALLADVIESTEPDPAALTAAEESAAAARSLATIGARLADAGEMLAHARHAALFDRLTEAGLISTDQRQALAADPAAPALSQLLRNAELAGHDSERVLADVLTGRSLDGARSVAQVLHHRLSEHLDGQLTPRGDTFADRLPPTTSPTWSRYLQRLADLADDRRRELGAQVAEQTPQWAVEALGPVPADPVAREEWEHRAGIVAAYREWVGWDDPAQPIGPAPRLGAVEARASWHAAWRALGRPEATAEEAELSNGALRVRVRAWEREQTWALAWVGDDLAATAQAAARYRQDAEIARARAAAATSKAERAAAQQEADHATAMADILTEQQRRLELVATARAAWYAHTAATREAAHRARAELARRGVAIEDPPDAVTAEQWLAFQAEAVRAEDPHRRITPQDLAGDYDAHRDYLNTLDEARQAEPAARMTPERSPTTPTAALPDGIPTLAETAAQVLRAQEALLRLADRVDLDARRRVEEEADLANQLAWTGHDQVAAHAREDHSAALERG